MSRRKDDRRGNIHLLCTWGYSRLYSLVEVEIEIGERSFTVEAAVVEKLPVSVLLRRDIPELVQVTTGAPCWEA